MKLTEQQKEQMSIQERVAWAQQKLERDYPPEVVRRIKETRKIVGRTIFAVVGYCRQCGGEIHYFDRAAGTGDLCLDCYSQIYAQEWEQRQKREKGI